ncbi:hypothetical protein CEN50_04440 [Fischerella thermalis CCMEE 5268]|uniref:Uncharacterized protein n=1 Tax=Fischerella thermalis CCMEE 5268 TaxID=2019662 RepID=A0A2N6KKB6_9CYAN|nr:hypothetical protein [Fischerella thermalis]PMB00106.1 hypothetical protein CEN50_04440 [Fischerella thermalis CCMEE 5268]
MTKSKYWKLLQTNLGKQPKVLVIPAAKRFFEAAFNESILSSDQADAQIQQQLLRWVRDDSNGEQQLLAERCLLCFISWEIKHVCLQLANQFGAIHGFTSEDLLSLVLDDDGSIELRNSYTCFSRNILQSFDPVQSSLKTWTSIRVKQHPEVCKFLLERGLYLVSDWAILNDTQPKQLQRILGEFHSLTSTEILQAQRLLESYHVVYRGDRLQQRARGMGGRCTVPTPEQLKQIAQHLESQTDQKILSETVMMQLQSLANYLRQYRIYIRGGILPTKSLDADDGDYNSLLERIPSPDTTNPLENEDEQAEFLQVYRPQFLACLDEALVKVTTARVEQIRRKDAQKAQKFLAALRLFHCERLSMSKIAQSLELRAQDAVTRLLKLKEFRADVRHQLLEMLRSRVLELAKNYTVPEHLAKLEDQIIQALDEQISHLINVAESEAQSSRNNSSPSQFTERLCQQLENIS